MKAVKSTRCSLLVGSIVLLIPLATRASPLVALGSGVAQPQAYESTSGGYSLHVRPHDQYGTGSASYQLAKNDNLIWSGEKDYTLRAVKLTDVGCAVGVVYRSVPIGRDGQAKRWVEYFHFVILDASGAEIRNEVIRRHWAHHSPSEPFPKQIIVDERHDRVVLRVRERGEPWGGPAWWVYRLSDGKSIERFNPRQRDPDFGNKWYTVDAEVIHGTPLIITHAYASSAKSGASEPSARFAVVGHDGRPVWSLEADGDYAERKLHELQVGYHFRRHPAILQSGEKGQFRLRFFASDRVTRYETRRDSKGNWTVTELETGEYVAPARTTSTLPVAGELTYLGRVQLGASPELASPYGKIHRFTFDKHGNIHFMFRDKTERWGRRSINAEGEITLERFYADNTTHRHVHWNDCPRIGDDKVLEVRKIGSDLPECTAFLVSLLTGQSEPLASWSGGYARSITRSKDGGIAIVTESGLALYDENGRQRWAIDDEARDIHGVPPDSVAFLKSGQLASLAGNEVKLIDQQGRPRKSIDLQRAFGGTDSKADPGYIREVIADADGGFILKNASNPPVALRFDASGILRSRWSPRFPDGRTFYSYQIGVAPDGRLWTTDGRVFMRLTDDGIVEHTIGQSPAGNIINELGGFTVGWDGRWYAVEKSTGSVFVYDPAGRQTQVAMARPGDFEGSVREAFVTVTPAGEIYVRRSNTRSKSRWDEYVHFDASGRPQTVVAFTPELESPLFGAGWAFQPGTGNRCGICRSRPDDPLIIVNSAGSVISETTQRPNGKWFEYGTVFAMAPDGTMAVMTADLGGNDVTLDLFDKNAKGIRSIPLPVPVRRYTGLAYDGRRAVVVARNEAVIVDIPDDRMTRWTLPGLRDLRRWWSAFLIAEGRELLLFDRKNRELHRYALP